MSRGPTKAGLGSLTVDSDRSLLSDLMLSRGVVDRQAVRRTDTAWLEERRSDPRSRVLRVHAGGALLAAGSEQPRLAWVPAPDVDGDLTFLGVDGEDIAYFAEFVTERTGEGWAELREVGALLDARDAGLVVTAVALDNWLRAHTRCPRCGALTEQAEAGWSRRCPEDGTPHFPRTDPAVIVLVRDPEDRALLGRQGRWAPGWYSTLAGFVEAGESAEAALRREVHEESGIVVGEGPNDIHYLGSQPWPFPASIMLGYHAWTADPDTIEVDGDEIAEARWFTRADLVAACEAGEVRLPPDISIARRLIERWYGGPLPGDWSRPLGLKR